MAACAATLLFFAAALSALLWPQWLHQPDLAHGLFMPVVFGLLLWDARGRAGVYLPPALAVAVQIVVGAAGLVLFAVAGLYAAALGWHHVLVEFLLSTALACLLGAGLAALADRRVARLPLNAGTVLAATLWILSAPIPPGTYSRLTLRLQLWITTAVMDALQLLGIAAHRHGNIIDLAQGSVGVEEACSGIRSLVSCVFVGLFFAAFLVRSPLSRTLVVLASAPLALAMNFVRALTLTLLANAGVYIGGAWHAIAGYGVLVASAAMLAGLAFGLERGEPSIAEGPASKSDPLPPASKSAGRPIGVILAAACVLLVFFVVGTRPIATDRLAPPDLASLMPPTPVGWRMAPGRDLARFASTLGTDHLLQQIYVRGDGPGLVQITFYLAYWEPGQASVTGVSAHSPDACWPAAGWRERAAPNPRLGQAVDGRLLPPAEARLFSYGSVPQYVWFWQLYDGRPIPYQNPYSLRRLLGIAWHYGFRPSAAQMFVSVASNRDWDQIAAEPPVRDFFARMRSVGL